MMTFHGIQLYCLTRDLNSSKSIDLQHNFQLQLLTNYLFDKTKPKNKLDSLVPAIHFVSSDQYKYLLK